MPTNDECLRPPGGSQVLTTSHCSVTFAFAFLGYAARNAHPSRHFQTSFHNQACPPLHWHGGDRTSVLRFPGGG
jgi:hypothetical protein